MHVKTGYVMTDIADQYSFRNTINMLSLQFAVQIYFCLFVFSAMCSSYFEVQSLLYINYHMTLNMQTST